MKKMDVFYSLFIVLYLLQQSRGDVHSINGYFMGSQGLNLPEYMERITIDDVTVYSHDSSTSAETPCPKCLNTTAGKQHWKDINFISHHNKLSMATALQSAILQFNQTGTSSHINIYQGHSRCELYPDGTLKALLTHAFNGKDFITLDIDRKTYIASVPQAVIYKRQREANPVHLEIVTAFYKKICFDRLTMFLQSCPEINKQKVPEVQIFERHKAGSTVLTCHVTGFYPMQIKVEWIGAGLQPVQEMTDVLPNGDGTYQTRRSVIIPEKKTESLDYICVVEHTSRNITTTWVCVDHTGLAVWVSCAIFILVFIGSAVVLTRFYKRRDAGI